MRGYSVLLCLAVSGLGCSLAEEGIVGPGVSTDAGVPKRDVTIPDVAHRADGGPLDRRQPPDSALDSPPAVEGDLTEAADAGDADDADDAADYGDATVVTAKVTYYGWDDNDPPGGAIAYPVSGGYPTVHSSAGGVGSYANPITMASSMSEMAIGSFVYVPYLQKYVVMEDDSPAADSAWTAMNAWQIVVWMNSNGTELAPLLTSCEASWARAATSIVIDPPAGLATDLTPLFDPSTNACLP